LTYTPHKQGSRSHDFGGALPLTDFSVLSQSLVYLLPWVNIFTSAILPQVHISINLSLRREGASIHHELLSLFGRRLQSSMGPTFVDPEVHRLTPLFD
jgi:hypothetical protein